MGIIIALISGALMSIQGVFNTEVTKNCGIWVTNCFVQFTALLACIVFWFFSGRQPFSNILRIDNKYMLLGGIIGAGITYTVIKSMDMIGPARAVLAIVIAQIIVAYIIEVFGIFGIEKTGFQLQKIIGGIIAIIGLIIFNY